MADHSFTPIIKKILKEKFKDKAELVYKLSSLLQYINFKTKAASRGAKARRSLANNYAIYVLVEDYIEHGFEKGGYDDYAGATFSHLLDKVRKLPFGDKFQNHALNSRCNDEFQKYFPASAERPIVRDLSTKKYWILERLIKIDDGTGNNFFIGDVIIK